MERPEHACRCRACERPVYLCVRCMSVPRAPRRPSRGRSGSWPARGFQNPEVRRDSSGQSKHTWLDPETRGAAGPEGSFRTIEHP